MTANGYTGSGGGDPIAIGDVTGLTTALAAKAPLASPTFTGTVAGITKSMIDLGSVDNTADTAKPVSTAQQTALNLKADQADLDALDARVVDLEEAPGGGGTAATITHGYVTAGNISATVHASWTVLDGLSVAVPAAIGDEVAFRLTGLFDHNAARTDFFEIVVIVGGAVARFASTGTNSPTVAGDGDPAISNNTTQFQGVVALPMDLTVEAGDLSDGNVTFGVAHKGAGGGKIFASTTYPLRWSARNDH